MIIFHNLDKLAEMHINNIRKYNAVNASVDAHLSKFQHLIPDIKRKKADLLIEILGEHTFKDIQEKLKQDDFKDKIKRLKITKHNSV